MCGWVLVFVCVGGYLWVSVCVCVCACMCVFVCVCECVYMHRYSGWGAGGCGRIFFLGGGGWVHVCM